MRRVARLLAVAALGLAACDAPPELTCAWDADPAALPTDEDGFGRRPLTLRVRGAPDDATVEVRVDGAPGDPQPLPGLDSLWSLALPPGDRVVAAVISRRGDPVCVARVTVRVRTRPRLTLLTPAEGDGVVNADAPLYLVGHTEPGATITLTSALPPETTLADAWGRFQLYGWVQPGEQRVELSATTEPGVTSTLSRALYGDRRPDTPRLTLTAGDRTQPVRAELAAPVVDPDGDALQRPRWSWTRLDTDDPEDPGVPVPDLTGPEVPADRLRRGQRWIVRHTVGDPWFDSFPGFGQATISDALPTSGQPQVSDEAPTAGSDLTCVPGPLADADGDEVSVTTTWWVDGSLAHEGPRWEAAPLRAGQFVTCAVTPRAWERDGATATSPPVVVANLAPTLRGATLMPPAPRVGELIRCVPVDPRDVDGPQPLRFEARWSVDAVDIGVHEALDTAGLAVGARVTCTLTADDGDLRADEAHAVTAVHPALSPANVLVVLVDDLGAYELAAHGSADPIPTPHLDALAAQARVFDVAWSTPVCSSTRAAMLTGRHGWRTGVSDANSATNPEPALPDGEITLPEWLRLSQPNAASALVGKWHLDTVASGGGGRVLAQGFDAYRGSLANLDPDVTTDGQDQSYYAWETWTDAVPSRREGYVTTAEVDDALAMARALAPPWLLWVALHAPHMPYDTPPEHLAPPPVGADMRSRYEAMVRALDTELGRLLAGLDEDTIVVFAADNGTPKTVAPVGFSERELKGTVHEGGVRVPLWIRAPWLPEPGVHTAAPVMTVDLFPTLAALAGAPFDDSWPVDGVDLTPWLVDPRAATPRPFIYTEQGEPLGFGPYERHERAVRSADHKLLRTLTEERFYRVDTSFQEGADLLDGPMSAEDEAAWWALTEALDAWDAHLAP